MYNGPEKQPIAVSRGGLSLFFLVQFDVHKLHSSLPLHSDMGDCVMCMSCVKNCDREAPEFNIRPIGVDFGLPWLLPSKMQKDPKHLAPSQVETNFWLGGIITILQGSVFLHYLPKLLVIVGIDPSIATEPPALNEPFFQHAALAFTDWLYQAQWVMSLMNCLSR